MRVPLRSCGVFACLSLLLGVATADEFERARADIRDFVAANNVPSITVAVARDGNIVWQESFGWANVAKRIPATPHTLYSLASISKPITTTGLMILVERGVIDLDKPMDDYLGEQKLTAHVGSAREATVRSIANHTSGLPVHYQFFYEDEAVARPTMDESIRRYGTLVRRPGEAYAYSNFGFGLLEYAMERAAGKSYAEFMRDELFLPLGLTQSAVNRTPDFGDQVALRYAADRSVVPFYDFDHRGASAVFMSAHDLVRFGIFHLQGQLPGQKQRVLQRSTLAAMLAQPAATGSEDNSSYGVGWTISERHGLKHVGHTGGMPGVATRLALYPQHGLVVVLLANAEVYHNEIESSIIHALVPETIRHDHGFKPEAGLVGSWHGAIQTHAGRRPVELEFLDDGSVFARVADGARNEATSVKLSGDGVLAIGGIDGSVGTPDAARYPYQSSFNLKRRGDVLNGSVSAVSRALRDREGNALSYWVELHRKTL